MHVWQTKYNKLEWIYTIILRTSFDICDLEIAAIEVRKRLGESASLTETIPLQNFK